MLFPSYCTDQAVDLVEEQPMTDKKDIRAVHYIVFWPIATSPLWNLRGGSEEGCTTYFRVHTRNIIAAFGRAGGISEL